MWMEVPLWTWVSVNSNNKGLTCDNGLLSVCQMLVEWAFSRPASCPYFVLEKGMKYLKDVNHLLWPFFNDSWSVSATDWELSVKGAAVRRWVLELRNKKREVGVKKRNRTEGGNIGKWGEKERRRGGRSSLAFCLPLAVQPLPLWRVCMWCVSGYGREVM